MSAGRYDFVIEQGVTFSKTFTWKDANRDPIDLTNYTARMQIRETVDSTSTIVSLTSSSGITLGGALGTIQVDITATVTAAMTFETAYYDLEVVSGASVVTRLLEGEVKLSKEVTR